MNQRTATWYDSAMQPWWRPRNLLASHIVSSYVALAIISVVGLATGWPDAQMVCLLPLAPLAIPAICADHLLGLRFVCAPYDGWHVLPLLSALYGATFAFRSVDAARDYVRYGPGIPGFCRTCGYDLTGNTSGVCPECGEPARGRRATPEPEND